MRASCGFCFLPVYNLYLSWLEGLGLGLGYVRVRMRKPRGLCSDMRRRDREREREIYIYIYNTDVLKGLQGGFIETYRDVEGYAELRV